MEKISENRRWCRHSICSVCLMLRPGELTKERTRTRRKRNVERKVSVVGPVGILRGGSNTRDFVLFFFAARVLKPQ